MDGESTDVNKHYSVVHAQPAAGELGQQDFWSVSHGVRAVERLEVVSGAYGRRESTLAASSVPAASGYCGRPSWDIQTILCSPPYFALFALPDVSASMWRPFLWQVECCDVIEDIVHVSSRYTNVEQPEIVGVNTVKVVLYLRLDLFLQLTNRCT